MCFKYIIGLLLWIDEIKRFFVLYGVEGIIIFKLGWDVMIFFKLLVWSSGVWMFLLNGEWNVIGVF